MKEYWNLITRPDDISDKDYAALMWAELSVILLIVLSGEADGIGLILLITNTIASIAYCIKYIDWSKVKE